MNKMPFNDDSANRGVEGWYTVNGETLILFVSATNSREDWISNFKCWPERLYPFSDIWVHAGYLNYAYWLKGYFLAVLTNIKITKLKIFGYSMGGGVAQVFGDLICEVLPVEVFNIDGPRVLSAVEYPITTFFNKGSLVHAVPPWFKKAGKEVCLNSKWRPVWISHADYNINEIIMGEVN
jgi:pimeloyl-ACP methyl ester carboxylesterase